MIPLVLPLRPIIKIERSKEYYGIMGYKEIQVSVIKDLGMASSNSTKTFAFNSRVTKYSPLNAYWLAVSSNLVYESETNIKKIVSSKWKLEKCDFISRKGTQCFIASTSKFVILAFRGTEMDKINDLVTDIDLKQTKAYDARVHAGFNIAYNAVKAKVVAKLKQHSANKKKLYITGHSLGGSLATIAARDLSDKGFKISSIYTFGQPRTGNSDFVKVYNKRFKNKSFRIKNKDDAVPKVVPKEIKIGKLKLEYSNTITPLYIVPKDRLATGYKASNDVVKIISNVIKAASSHSMDKYEKTMQKNVNTNPFDKPYVYKEKGVVKLKKVKKAANKEVKKAKRTVEKETKKAKKTVNKAAKNTAKKAKKFGKKLKKLF